VAGPYKVSEGQLLNGAHPSIGGDCVWGGGANYIGVHETGAGAITCQIKRSRGRLTLTPGLQRVNYSLWLLLANIANIKLIVFTAGPATHQGQDRS
jgi:hypothetical protein